MCVELFVANNTMNWKPIIKCQSFKVFKVEFVFFFFLVSSVQVLNICQRVNHENENHEAVSYFLMKLEFKFDLALVEVCR